MRSVQRITSQVIRFLPVVVLAGCGGLESVATYDPITDPTQLYMTLQVDQRAVNLSTVAPYDTLQLTATPLNALDEPLSGLPAPTFQSLDTTTVWVTPEGLLQARNVTSTTKVIASLAIGGNVRHTDTVLVQVTNLATPPVLDTLSIHPLVPDSAVFPLLSEGLSIYFVVFSGTGYPFGSCHLPKLLTRMVTSTGDPISGLLVSYKSLDPTVAQTNGCGAFGDPFEVAPVRPGHVKFVAQTTAYGIKKVDTVSYTITYRVAQGIDIQETGFTPSEVVLATHGTALWFNDVVDSAGVTFDDPAAAAEPPAGVCGVPEFFGAPPAPYCGTGNIAAFPGGNGFPFTADGNFAVRARQFNTAGTYSFRNTRTGATGRVIVVDPPAP